MRNTAKGKLRKWIIYILMIFVTHLHASDANCSPVPFLSVLTSSKVLHDTVNSASATVRALLLNASLVRT